MGDPREAQTAIDDMGGLYKSTAEAFRSGERLGRVDFCKAAINRLSWISLKYEKAAPNDDLATRGFHVAEECIADLQKLRDLIEAREASGTE